MLAQPELVLCAREQESRDKSRGPPGQSYE